MNRLLRPKSVRHMSVTTATRRLTAAHHEARRHSNKKARETGKTQLTGYLRRWWQVLGSNQRRLSRRFYRGLPDKIAYSLWPAETRILTTLSDKLNHSSTESRSGSPDMSGRRRLSRTRSFDCLKPARTRGAANAQFSFAMASRHACLRQRRARRDCIYERL